MKSSTQTDTDAGREALELSEGVNRLGKLEGVASIARGLRHEDEAVRREAELYRNELFGIEDNNASEAEEMNITAARDVIIQRSPDPEPPAAQSSLEPTPAKTDDATPPRPMSNAAKVATALGAAAILAVGMPASSALIGAMVAKPVAETAIDTMGEVVAVQLYQAEKGQADE